jgi:hypothetical protein
MINISRNQSVPPSLAAQKTYRNTDVIEALHTIFNGKCYLTERVFDYPEEMEIDHFATQNDNGTLVYEWTNLYPIDQKANKMRLKSTPPGGYLDPCHPDDDVEKDIVYIIEFGGNALFKPANPVNQKAVNTATLLNRVHRDLKPTIAKKHHEVVFAIANWNTAKAKGDTKRAYEEELVLRKLLARDSHFTMLMRAIWAVANDEQLIEFFD